MAGSGVAGSGAGTCETFDLPQGHGRDSC